MPSSRDVLPDVELGPVREREHAHVLARLDEAVVEVPQLGPLGLRVPLAEVVAEGEDALLRAGALLVAAGAAEGGLEAVLLDRVEQRHRLEPVARGARAASPRPRGRCRSSPAPRRRSARAPSSATMRSRYSITSGKLWPVSTCITGNGSAAGRNAFSREVQQHGRVLAAGEQQHAALELGGDLADHVDGLGLERPQV